MHASARPESERLSDIYMALAHPTRRAVIDRLGRGAASVSELARPFDIGLPSFMKHLRVLEEVGMIRTDKEGRTRTCEIDRSGLAEAEQWLSEQRAIWEGRTERLEAFVLREQARERLEDAESED